MTAYEHISVLISFLVSLGFAHVAVGLASMIQSPAKVRVSLPHAAWVLVAAGCLLDLWLGVFEEKDATRFTVAQILLMVTHAMSAYLLAALVMPAAFVLEEQIDLRDFHARQHRSYTRAFIGFIALDGVIAIALDPEMQNIETLLGMTVMVGAVVALPVASLFVRRRWIQIAAPAVLLMLLTAYWMSFPTFE